MSPETRDFLATVRKAEAPSPGDESRVLAALEAAVAGGLTSAAAGSAPATKGTAAVTGSGLKIVGMLLGVSLGAALVAAAVSSRPAEPSVAVRPQRAPVSSAPAFSNVPAVPIAAPPTSAPAVSTGATSPSTPHPSAPKAPGTALPNSVSLREEIALLAGVQRALEQSDGAEALRQLDQHATGDRQFVAERRAARIAALCLLGRVPEAQALAAVFFRENGQSVQRTAVERSCAATKTDPER